MSASQKRTMTSMSMGQPNEGLFKSDFFKLHECEHHIFYIRSQDQLWGIVYKSKNHKDRQWHYVSHDNYRLVYDKKESGGICIKLIVNQENVKRVKVDKLYSRKLMICENGLVINRISKYSSYGSTHSNGYVRYTSVLNKNENFLQVHRLVAHAFCPRPEHLKDVGYKYLHVNHKNGIKTSNHYKNLEWCTPSENNIHARDTGLSASGEDTYNAALDNDRVKEIRRHYIKYLYPYKYYQEKYNISFDVVQAMLNNKTYYDSKYVVPEFVGKRKITFADAQWIREHKRGNPTAALSFFAKKFGCDPSTIGKVFQNRLHIDPTFDPESIKGKHAKRVNDYVETEIVKHKKDNPHTPLSYYCSKYELQYITILRIINKHFNSIPVEI